MTIRHHNSNRLHKSNVQQLFALTTCVSLFLGGAAGCSRNAENTAAAAPASSISEAAVVNTNDIRTLADKHIFFGHQSVGGNILEGVQDVQKDLPVTELEDAKAIASAKPGLFHAMVGSNGDPGSKIKEFEEMIRGGVGNKADIAFFKFCYIDITEDTDVPGLFQQYKQTMTGLAKAYPDTKFVHVTIPLRAAPGGTKAALKSLLGKGPGTLVAANKQREEFNEMLRKEYAGKQPVFDLATVESTKADGSRSTIKIDGKSVPSLVPDYSYDGKHLNETGRKIVANQFLSFLAKECGGTGTKQVATSASNR